MGIESSDAERRTVKFERRMKNEQISPQQIKVLKQDFLRQCEMFPAQALSNPQCKCGFKLKAVTKFDQMTEHQIDMLAKALSENAEINFPKATS
jgi:hypothetical protein